MHKLYVTIFYKKNNITDRPENFNNNQIQEGNDISDERIINEQANDTNINEVNYNNNKKIIGREGLTKILLYYCCSKKENRKRIIIDNYKLDIYEHQKYCLCNNNGFGKTMIFKCIINEILYEDGSIKFYKDNNNFNDSNDFNGIKNRIGYCPQININSFNNMTIREIIQCFINLKILDNIFVNYLT